MLFRAITALCSISAILAFSVQPQNAKSFALNAKSKAVPFLEQPPALKGGLAGEAGFDPLGLSSRSPGRDWSYLVMPKFWDGGARPNPITTIDWMVEAEIKHCRLAMLAFLGWVATDSGLRLPLETFSAIPNNLAAHDMAVANGGMGLLLNVVAVLEIVNGAAIVDQARGSGRKSGEFNFDPLNLGKDATKRARYATSEVKNGRAAMLAISGLLTQAALFPDQSFPFL